MKLKFVPGARFTCRRCTQCCRLFHVPVTEEDLRALQQLAWPQADPLATSAATKHFRGQRYLAQKPCGACIYLDEETRTCKIHVRFGASEKPLACRLFPFSLAATFEGEVSVSRRFDCPSVRKNDGRPCSEQRKDLQSATPLLTLSDTLSDSARAGLERKAVETIVSFIQGSLSRYERDADKASFLLFVSEWLESLTAKFLNTMDLGRILPPLVDRMREQMATIQAPRPGRIERFYFRVLLAFYMRRDEDVLQRRANRFMRALSIAKVVLGRGNLQRLGCSHRSAPLTEVKLFSEGTTRPPDTALQPFWELVRERLLTLQFMGRANLHNTFFFGLRSLALLYPLVLAVAHTSRASRGNGAIDPDDLDYAVAGVAHSFGRYPLLGTTFGRHVQKALGQRATFRRLTLWL
ncbi:YkgJ family cysteine cluster protein [Planctomycetota bacterium]